MAYHNKIYDPRNTLITGLGVGPYDYATYTYGTGGGTSNTNLTDIHYFRGGDNRVQIAHVRYTYNADDNVATVERIE